MQLRPEFWKEKAILVTGGTGFLGSHIVDVLHDIGVTESQIRVTSSREHDLRERSACRDIVKEMDIVIHCAVRGGGIGFNREYPGTIFYDNITMTTELMEAARLAGVKTFVGIGTICSYPKIISVPFSEEDLWSGYPEETNAAYGLAKKMMLVQSNAYRQQFGFHAVNPLFENMYGPRDHFDPSVSHVVPALIRKIAIAKEEGAPTIDVWGTGSATRGFLYVKDAARAALLAAEYAKDSEPMNIGSGEEISIKTLVGLIAECMEFQGEIHWDASKPDGQPRRSVDASRASERIGFTASTPFRVGLAETIRWYHENRHSL